MTQEINNQKVLGKYRVIRTIGAGQFKVKLVYDPKTGTQYAAKVSKYNLKKAALEKEAVLLRDLNKFDLPNIIKSVEYIDVSDTSMKKTDEDVPVGPQYNFKAALILEYAPNEALFDVVFHNKKFEEKLARTYFKKLIETVQNLHKKGFVHRDLKLENILLDKDFQIKLADFGFAKEFTELSKDMMTTRLGTESYMAPEMHVSKTYSGTKVDVFACGVLLFLFMLGKPPFFKATANDPFFKNFAQGKPEKFWSIYEEKLNQGKEFDGAFKSLINQLFEFNPEKRLDTEEILKHEWMKGEVYTDEELIDVMKPLKENANQESKKKN